MRHIFVVGAAFDDEDAEVGGRGGEAPGDDAACCAPWRGRLVWVEEGEVPPAMMMSTSVMESESLL